MFIINNSCSYRGDLDIPNSFGFQVLFVLPIWSDRHGDIEDVTERYLHMFTEKRDSDIVKKGSYPGNRGEEA